MDSYSVQAVLSVKDKNFTSTMKSASNTLSGLDSSTSKASSGVGALGTAFAVAQSIVSGACNVIKNSVQAAVERVDTLNQYPKIMEQMGFSSQEAEASVQKLSDRIQGLPTSLDSIVSSTQSIALLTGDLDLATNTALALNDAFLASGSSTAEAERGLTQYTQMLSSGKVDMQSWKTLQETMGYALSETAKQLGITSGNTYELYSALQSGQITFDEFNAAIIECDTAAGGFAETASIACEGIATSWENVKTAVVRGVANMIQAWNEAAADNGIPTIQESLRGLQSVCDTVFTAASKAITVFVNNLDMIVGAVAPVVAAVAGLKIVNTVSGYFKDFKNSGKQAADALKNYKQTAEQAKTASKNLETAQKAVKSAAEKQTQAFNKACTATEKVQQAEKKVAEATKERDQAMQAGNASTEQAEQAAQKYNEAEEELAAAQKEQAAAEKELQAAREQTATATEMAAEAEEREGAALEGATLSAIAHNAILAVMSGEMTIATAAQEALNAAMAANPIGLVVTAISALVSVLSIVINLMKKFCGETESAYKSAKNMKEEVEELSDAWDEERKSQQDSVEAAKNSAAANEDLCSKITALATQENLSASEVASLNAYLSILNDNVEGLDASYDSLTGSMNMSLEVMNAQVDAANALNECNAIQEAYNDSLSRQSEIKAELSEKTQALTELEDQMTEAAQNGAIYGVAAKHQLQVAIEDLEAQEQEEADLQTGLLDQLGDAQLNYTELVQDAYDQQSAALEQAVENQSLTLDMLTEENQATAESLQSTWQDYTDIATDMFDTLDTEVSVTVDDMIENMERNQEIMAQWGDNTEALRDRFANLGLDPAILDQLVDLGPEGAGYIQELCDASDEKLEELVDVYSEGGETAYTAMGQSLGEGASEVMDQAKNLITQTESSLREQVEITDWTDAGQAIPKGVAEGVESGQEEVFNAMDTLGNTAITEFGAAIGWGSPAAEFIPAGESIPEGVAEGVNNSTAALDAVNQMAEELITALDTALAEMDFTDSFSAAFEGLAETSITGMEQISQAVTSGMALVEQAVTTGMQTAATAMTTGFSNMGSSVSSEMSSIASVVSSGMANVSSVMTSGVQGVRNALTTGFANMSSSVTTAMSSIQSAVSSGMSSVSSTMTSGVNNVKQVLTQGFTQMATTTTTQMNKIKTTVTTNMNNIKSTITSSLNSIKSTWSSAMSSIQTSTSSGMSRVKSVWQSGMNSIKSMAQSTKSSVISTFNSMYSGMYSAGANAMSGLQAGLNSRRGSVIATAQSIASAVTSTINSALKVGSPSKVLKETGKYAGQGLVNGLKAMLSDVQKISEQMADMVTSIAIGEFDSPKLAFAGMDMSVSYDYGTEDILNRLDSLESAILEDAGKPIQVDTSIDIDGKEVAKATATYTQEQLDKLQARQSRRDKFSISGG